MRDQGVSDQKLCLSRVGEATAGAGTGGILEVAWTSVSNQPVDWLLFPRCTGPSCPYVARIAVLEEGRAHTNREHKEVWPDSQDLCTRNSGGDLAPNMAEKATENRGSLCLTCGFSPGTTDLLPRR